MHVVYIKDRIKDEDLTQPGGGHGAGLPDDTDADVHSLAVARIISERETAVQLLRATLIKLWSSINDK